MTTSVKNVLVKIAAELLKVGVPKESAERIAVSVFVDEAVKNGMDMGAAYELIFGPQGWDEFAALF